MKILAAAITLATSSRPQSTRRPRNLATRRRPSTIWRRIARSSETAWAHLETSSRRLASTLRCMIFRVTGTSLIERRDLFSEQHE